MDGVISTGEVQMTKALPLDPELEAAIAQEVCGWQKGRYHIVAKKFGITAQRVVRIVERHRNREEQPYRRRPLAKGERPIPQVISAVRPNPSQEAIAEAIRAYSAPRTLTALLMGDPPKGRSSLDQKRQLRVVT
jgi:hypothetical protein